MGQLQTIVKLWFISHDKVMILATRSNLYDNFL